MSTHTQYHDEDPRSASAAGDAIDEYYSSQIQTFELNDAMSDDENYSALRWILAKAIDNADHVEALTVGGLDGTLNGANWLVEGYTLSAEDVAWIRSLRAPKAGI